MKAQAITWRFEATEVSPGHFELTARRSTGNKVYFHTDNPSLVKLYTEAFNMELSFGTSPSDALYKVISSAKSTWTKKYHDEFFGSWQVLNPRNNERYIFDGKDCLLTYYNSADKACSSFCLNEKADTLNNIFKKL